MTLDGYVRVSAVRGRCGETFISPSVQREKIHAYARLHGHTIGHVWEELDESGGRMDRPMFQKMLTRVKRGQTGGVIVAKLDRFARNLTGALAAIEQIESAGGQLVVVDEQFDTTTPIGRAIMRILLVLAELHREQISENWRTANERAVDRGVHVTPRVPAGYTRPSSGSRLELDPKVAPIVKRLFRMRARGAGHPELAALLNQEGVLTSYGNRHWTPTTAGRIVRNRVYLGEARGPGGIARGGAHPALVDEELFAAANLPRVQVGSSTGQNLLSGLVRCAACRYMMSKRGPSYVCQGNHSAGRCPKPAAIRVGLLETHVVDAFFAALGPAGVLARLTRHDADLEKLRANLEQADRELAAWRDDTAIADLDRQVYRDGLSHRVQRRNQAADLLAKAAHEGGLDGLPTIVELHEQWPKLTVQAQRKILQSVIDVVFLRGGRAPVADRSHICWRGQGPLDLPRRAKLTPMKPFVFPDDDSLLPGEQLLDDLAERVKQPGTGRSRKRVHRS